MMLKIIMILVQIFLLNYKFIARKVCERNIKISKEFKILLKKKNQASKHHSKPLNSISIFFPQLNESFFETNLFWI